MPNELQLQQTFARPYLPLSQSPQVAYVLLEMIPTATAAQVQMPINLAFVLDRSGSMRGAKLRAMKQAVQLALERLNDADTVSITTFSHTPQVLVPTSSAANRYAIARQVEGLRDDGGTRIGRGLAAGLDELVRAPGGRLSRLVLLTDGETDRDEAECLDMANRASISDIPIMAFGVGNEWNDKLLSEIAQRSRGEVEHLRQPDEIVQMFDQTVQQAQNAVFQNAQAVVRLVEGIQPRAAWQVVPLIKNLGYRPLSDRAVNVPIEQLASNERRVLLLELMVNPRPAGQYRIGQAEVQYDVPLLGVHAERTAIDLVLTITADQALTQRFEPQVMNVVEKITAFKLQTRAFDDIEAGNISGATQKLQGAVTRLMNSGETELAETIQRETQRLEEEGTLSTEGAKTIRFGTRKTVRLGDLGKK
jgi:Ca-activated chloride channel family protein